MITGNVLCLFVVKVRSVGILWLLEPSPVGWIFGVILQGREHILAAIFVLHRSIKREQNQDGVFGVKHNYSKKKGTGQSRVVRKP